MGKRPMVFERPYKLKLATAQVLVRLKKLERVIDAADLKKESKREIGRHDVARCVLEAASPVAFDLTQELEATGRFVIVDEYDIAGGGIILEAIEDHQAEVRKQVAEREEKWDVSTVEPEERVQRYGHRPAFVLLTGKVGLDKKGIARALEKDLFERGAKTYLLGMGNLLRGLNADMEQHRLQRHEHVRRMGEVANLLLEAGLIVIATGSNLSEAELKELQEVVPRQGFLVVNVGPCTFREELADLALDPGREASKNAGRISELLRARGILS